MSKQIVPYQLEMANTWEDLYAHVDLKLPCCMRSVFPQRGTIKITYLNCIKNPYNHLCFGTQYEYISARFSSWTDQ